jgi:methylenetetrahydrofolate dehydrogenase (NADP+)/methenyltetrahydrofolate cyclohydrolase
MAKILNGKELSLFIKEQQAREVRSLRQSKGVNPKLVIIRTNPNPITDTYVRLKKNYGEEIGIITEIIDCDEQEIKKVIGDCNNDLAVHGVIVQLPLINQENSKEILNLILPEKDVDGLGENAAHDPATPTAINWLLAGYNINLEGKKILIMGKGRLVGSPLADIWSDSGYQVFVADSKTVDVKDLALTSDIIVTATGKPGVLTSDMVKTGAVVVDAGVATDSNGLIGDVDNSLRNREDITITPEKGGVGPLTVSALFHNLLVAARKSVA